MSIIKFFATAVLATLTFTLPSRAASDSLCSFESTPRSGHTTPVPSSQAKIKVSQHPIHALEVFGETTSGHVIFCDIDAADLVRLALTPTHSSGGLLLSVSNSKGRTVVPSTRIADCHSAVFAFWSFLNSDNIRDYVIIVWSGGSDATISFILSESGSYQLNTLSALMPKVTDFVSVKYPNAKKSTVRFLHTSNLLINKNQKAQRVESLLAFIGARVHLDKSEPKFPRLLLKNGKRAAVSPRWMQLVRARIENCLLWRSRIERDNSIAMQ